MIARGHAPLSLVYSSSSFNTPLDPKTGKKKKVEKKKNNPTILVLWHLGGEKGKGEGGGFRMKAWNPGL